jgi:nicotinate dehydrogenase subunit A
MVELTVNGRVERPAVDPATPLLSVLRDELGLTGAKHGCGLEQCRACAVIVDGVAETSCTTPVGAVAGKSVTTVEGIGTPGALDPVQQALIDEHAAQCGYCIPGIVVALRALLDRNPRPADDAVRAALAGHLCRCGSHPRILRAARRLAAGAPA